MPTPPADWSRRPAGCQP